MTPRTRAGNQDAEFTVYYSKKVPQQVHFPHKRKIVRRPSSPVRGNSGKRQMVFLPDKMKARPTETIRDSDEETEDEGMEDKRLAEVEQVERERKHAVSRSRTGKGKKRSSDNAPESENNGDEPVPSTAKRRRTTTTVKTERTLRRQSTMTQLVDGRRPQSDAEEPDFKPVKRGSRLSWGGKGRSKSKDKQQRTLTQMIPGMRPIEIVSDEDLEDVLSDLEASDEDSQAYDLAVAQRLAVQEEEKPISTEVNLESLQEDAEHTTAASEDHDNELPVLVLQSVEHAKSDDGEESYIPTQFIDAPSSRSRRTVRRSTKAAAPDEAPSVRSTPAAPRVRKARFSLLKTPEKRRIREIPSSQSPADSPLSTQVSPQKLQRSPLHKSSGNSVLAPETPSKRKRVAFKEPSAPPTLKKFESTIQDSEDEDDGIEDEIPQQDALQNRAVQSPELGEMHTRTQVDRDHVEQDYDTSKPSHDHDRDAAPPHISTLHLDPINAEVNDFVLMSTEAPIPYSTECLHSTPPLNDTDFQETFPSTPMVIQDDSSDEEATDDPIPPRRSSPPPFHPSPANVQHTADLDGEPIQVPRSPSAQHETQQSHSSKAEQQLQSEWFSYSQYVNTQPPTSSSMFVVHDPSSYGVSHSLQRNTAPQSHSAAHPPSQATTLDEVTQRTPRKNRTQQMTSANTTPRRVPSSQPVISPSKPPRLFIPSSFPSPAKSGMQEWSSPVFGRTQDVLRSSQYSLSLEDFSIPLPPPLEDESEEET